MSWRRWVGGLGVGGLGVGVAVLTFLPSWAPWMLARQGVAVAAVTWCDPGDGGTGLCADGLRAGRIEVDRASIARDRRVRLRHVRVRLEDAERGEAETAEVGSAEAGEGISARLDALTRWLTAVEVDDLVVAGVPLPSLSGEVWPRRSLRGEGVEVEDDLATLTRDTPWGPATIEAELVEGEARIAAKIIPFSLEHPRLGGLLRVAEVSLTGTWRPGRPFVGTVLAGDVAVNVTADPEGAHTVRGSFELPPTDLGAVYAVFGSLVPEASRATIRGNLQATGEVVVHLDGADPEITLTPGLERAWVDGLVPAGFGQGEVTWVTVDPDGGRTTRSTSPASPDWLPLDRAGTWLPAAILAAEDGAFRTHPGYDLAGMLLAASENAEAGDIKRGGSTLTQQLAKNLFTGNERTYARKLRELLYAVEMERELGKPGILQLYLNIVEWGPGIYGALPAARTYFVKAPSGLLPEEAAWMAAVLRSPKSAYERQYLRGEAETSRLAQVLGNMIDLDDGARQAALARGVHFVPP